MEWGMMKSIGTAKPCGRYTCPVVLGWVVVLLLPTTGSAQRQRLQVINRNAIQIRDIQAAGVFDAEPQTVEPEFGAVLKTDPDLEASLATAERFREDNNYRVATQLWQAVLQRSGDALYSSDGKTYYSLVQQVEQILADLPPAGLAVYRVTADAEAKEILAQANDPNDITSLNRVVRQYFISSLGDDAAYRLGCIYLDQFDFIGARRMFEKIVNQYPDPSIDMHQVRLRIALCQSYLGEIEAANQSLEEAKRIGGETNQLIQVQRTLGELTSDNSSNVVSSDWLMPVGNARRDGVMLAPPRDLLETDLVAAWQFFVDPRDKYSWTDAMGKLLVGKDSFGDGADETQSGTDARMIKSWREKGWRPAGHLLMNEGRVYFKSAADMTVWDAHRVATMIEEAPDDPEWGDAVGWRSVWRNAFQVDAATQMIQTIRRSWGGYGNRGGNTAGTTKPESIAEVQLFGDRIQQQLSIHDGILYSLEGSRFDEKNRKKAQRVSPQWNTSFRRTRSNFLTAYDAVSGEVLWTLPRQDQTETADNVLAEGEEPKWLEAGGFMAAPIGFGEFILVPVNNGGSISIYALDPANQGKTVWNSFLCDEPESGAEPWSPINLSIDGSDLFVNTGMGVVFVLDPATGLVRFAKRYERVGTPDDFRRRSGWTINRLNFHGWSSDVILPYGRQMICFCSDTETIEALDRNTGQLIWRSDMSPIGYKVDYLLGVYNDMLFAAGRETVVAYDLNGEGRMIWGADQMFEGKQSFGRGMLTPNGLYMPVEDSIYHFSLPNENGKAKLVSRVEVNFGTGAPVGNLYSDGSRIWVHGANRLYALAPRPD
jgi:tetratricopeptide (TPR) repeat protein